MIFLLRRCLLILFAICFSMTAQAEYYDELVRLHVIANDDSDAAQGFKLEIRDAVLNCAQEMLDGCEDASAAWDVVNAHLSDFLAAAQARAEQLGFDGSLSVQAGVFEFPDRVYGDVVVPAGDYRALRVIIGDGAGQNWWCVLYPDLCMPSEDGYYSIVLNWLKKWFGGIGE